MYGRPRTQVGFGELGRVEIFVNDEKIGKVEKIYLDANLEQLQDIPMLAKCIMAPAPEPPKK